MIVRGRILQFKFTLKTIAGLLFAASCAQAEVFDCEMGAGNDRGFLTERYIIIPRGDDVLIYDAMALVLNDSQPILTEVTTHTEKVLKARWTIGNVPTMNLSTGRQQSETEVSYKLRYKYDKQSVVVSAQMNGQPLGTKFGKCQKRNKL